MVFAIVWQKRALAVGAVLAATTLSVAGVAAATGRNSPGAIGTKLAAVGQSNGVVDVFWRGADHQLWHSRFYPNTSSWTRPRDLGGSLR